jgi:guanylate kinase
MSTLLLKKPDDVYDFAQDYFSYFNIEKDKVIYPPIVIMGPPCVGKVNI